VRDLLLGAPVGDADLVVEGDAAALAARLARDLGARSVRHPRFGTATVQSASFRLDFARARTERYARPGALPVVRPGRLVDDLARRDFTINAMALRLSGRGAGALIDPFDGREDLARGVVRVLHDRSFQDDPTRILRALRYAGRLGFRLEGRTALLLKRDLRYLDAVSGARLRHELERIAVEERVGRIVRLALRAGALQAAHPALRADERRLRAVARLPRVAPAHRAAVLLALLLSSAGAREIEAAVARLSMTGAQARAVRGCEALRAEGRRLARVGLQPSAAVAVLERYPIESTEAFVLLATPLAARRARRYLDQFLYVEEVQVMEDAEPFPQG
jgi:tRNA nucleotidyltransferase (CCA-adding enzyme)